MQQNFCIETDLKKKIPDTRVKDCLQEYKLQDKVDALKNVLGIKHKKFNSSCNNESSPKLRKKKIDETGVKDCLRPTIPSSFQSLVTELRDTIRNSYWNKEIGKSVYLVPNLPAGCDPFETTFGKASTRREHGVAEILNPGNDIIALTDELAHELYRTSHDDYDPGEQVDRKYLRPFDKFSSFGEQKKSADFSGKKAANCLQWFDSNSTSLVSRKFAEFSNRTQSRLGKVRNYETSRRFNDFTFGKNLNGEVEAVADVLREFSTSPRERDIYCSVYANEISKHCGSSQKNIKAAGITSERSNLRRAVLAAGAAKCEAENLGDQTSAKALLSPSVFTQMSLSHLDFFKVRSCEEIRSIFENIGVEFPDNSFDVLWAEGARKDCTGGVCIETFRNLLASLAINNFNKGQT